MSNTANLRTITNHYEDVRLVSLASWSKASEISPRDRHGPYVVTQEGYDPKDMKLIADEFVLGRSGKWLSLSTFFRLPVEERRAEFVFGTAAEIMQTMSNLPSQVVMLGDTEVEAAPATPESDAMAAAFQAGKGQTPGAAS